MNAKESIPSELDSGSAGNRSRQSSGQLSTGGATIFVTQRIQIPLSEITFTFVRSSGPGGQNVNKVNTKAVMRWSLNGSAVPESVQARFRETFRSRVTKEGDVVLTSQRYRDQARNRDDCIEKLRGLLLAVAQEPKQRRATRPSAASRRRRRQDKQLKSQKKKLRKSPSRDD